MANSLPARVSDRTSDRTSDRVSELTSGLASDGICDRLLFKSDWADARPRLEAWWHGEVIDRVALAVTAPREEAIDGYPEAAPEPDDPYLFWFDFAWRLASAEATLARTHYLGEAFPYFAPQLGPGSIALYLGSEPTVDKATIWYNPTFDSLATPPELRFDPENRWWRLNRDFVLAAVERGRGKYLVTHPDIIENLDVLASLRGTEPLLLDMLDHAASVHAVQAQVNDLYFRYFDDLYHPIAEATPGGGCASLFRVWGPGKVAKVQCDFAALISPRMFRDFVVPYLAEQCERLDYAVFHLDGPQCIGHVEALCEIPRLHAIQWTPGAANPGVGSPDWYDLYRKIRRGGKSCLILGAEPEEVEPLVREVGPEGLLISTKVESRAESESLLARARTW